MSNYVHNADFWHVFFSAGDFDLNQVLDSTYFFSWIAVLQFVAEVYMNNGLKTLY